MKTIRNFLAMAIIALASLLPLTANAQSSLQQVISSGVLRVGVIQSPPWFFKTSTEAKWAGLGIDIGEAMAKDLGVKLKLVPTTWGNAVAGLEANQFDLMFVLDATPQRALAVDFPSAPLLYYAMAVMHHKEFKVTSWSQLDNPGVSIAVAQGTAIDSFISRVMPKANIQRFAGQAQAVAAFQSGRTKLVAMFHPALISFRKRLGYGEITLPTPIFASASSVGVRRMADRSFADWVSTTIAYFYNTGRTQQWFEQSLKTLGVDPGSVPPIQRELWPH